MVQEKSCSINIFQKAENALLAFCRAKQPCDQSSLCFLLLSGALRGWPQPSMLIQQLSC